MRPITKYKIGEKMRNCIFLEEKETLTVAVSKDKQFYFRKRMGLFKCQCGKEFIAAIIYIRNGNIKSCGCLRDNKIQQQGFKNVKHNLRHHPLYKIWKSMLYRCENTNNNNYHNYGERGISVCERWHNVENFVNDVYPTYKKGLQLDRINNDGNYEPSNCRWVTRKENCNNTRKNKFIEYNGMTKTISEWADYSSLPYYLISSRLNNYNWSIERTLTTPHIKLTSYKYSNS